MTPAEQSRLPAHRAPCAGWARLEALVPRIERDVAMGARPRIGMMLDGCAVAIGLTLVDDVEIDVIVRLSPDLMDRASEKNPWGGRDDDRAQVLLRTLRLALAAPIIEQPAVDPDGQDPRATIAALLLDEAMPDDGGIGIRAASIRLATPLGTGGVAVFETNGPGLLVDRSPEFVVPGPLVLDTVITTDMREGMRIVMTLDAPRSRIEIPVLDPLGRMRLEADAAAIRKERER